MGDRFKIVDCERTERIDLVGDTVEGILNERTDACELRGREEVRDFGLYDPDCIIDSRRVL